MQKQELVHLHALFHEVRVYLEGENAVGPEAFAAYDAQVRRPNHVYRGKDVHENAIGLLLDGFDHSVLAVLSTSEVPN